MGSDAESEAKLAAPKLFGRKKPARTPEAATEHAPDVGSSAEAAASPAESPAEAAKADDTPVHAAVATQPRATEPPRPARTGWPARTGRARSGVPRPSGMPAITGMQAAAITGLLVGAFLVLATYGALNLCSTVRGASTCGGRAGFPLLLAIGLVAVVGGGTLLRAFRVTSPMGDSFLAVALVTVLAVLFLNDHYGAWWMILAVPALTIAAYLLAHWVSATYIDPVDD
ncbi:hypothetical protein [Nocardioides sp. Iso805N]|uniref:hypothetical protein n=1 Tax=Nocardioides sp. Iso805N TaxID=1283287 RepID=UPI0012FA6BE7|nr:hypothetical protein [Nocardioides sp. Iso805N]